MGNNISSDSEYYEEDDDDSSEEQILYTDRRFKLRDPELYETNPEGKTSSTSNDKPFTLRGSRSIKPEDEDDNKKPMPYADRPFKLRDPELYENNSKGQTQSTSKSRRFKLRRGSQPPAYEDLFEKRNDKRFKLRPEPSEQGDQRGARRGSGRGDRNRAARNRKQRQKRGADAAINDTTVMMNLISLNSQIAASAASSFPDTTAAAAAAAAATTVYTPPPDTSCCAAPAPDMSGCAAAAAAASPSPACC